MQVGGVVLVIDAKTEKVARWYASYGAVSLLGASLTLLLPLTTIEAALKNEESETILKRLRRRSERADPGATTRLDESACR